VAQRQCRRRGRACRSATSASANPGGLLARRRAASVINGSVNCTIRGKRRAGIPRAHHSSTARACAMCRWAHLHSTACQRLRSGTRSRESPPQSGSTLQPRPVSTARGAGSRSGYCRDTSGIAPDSWGMRGGPALQYTSPILVSTRASRRTGPTPVPARAAPILGEAAAPIVPGSRLQRRQTSPV